MDWIIRTNKYSILATVVIVTMSDVLFRSYNWTHTHTQAVTVTGSNCFLPRTPIRNTPSISFCLFPRI
jgi:hypothetical protein